MIALLHTLASPSFVPVNVDRAELPDGEAMSEFSWPNRPFARPFAPCPPCRLVEVPAKPGCACPRDADVMSPHGIVALMAMSFPITEAKRTIATTLLKSSPFRVVLAYDDNPARVSQADMHKRWWTYFPRTLDYQLLRLSYARERAVFGKKIDNFNGKYKDNPARLGAFRWFARSSYRHMWMFEDDTWSPDYGAFMGAYANRTAHLIGHGAASLPSWYRANWRVGTPAHGLHVPGVRPFLFLTAIRMSRAFARILCSEINRSRTTSHHEIFLPYGSMLKMRFLTAAQLGSTAASEDEARLQAALRTRRSHGAMQHALTG